MFVFEPLKEVHDVGGHVEFFAYGGHAALVACAVENGSEGFELVDARVGDERALEKRLDANSRWTNGFFVFRFVLFPVF